MTLNQIVKNYQLYILKTNKWKLSKKRGSSKSEARTASHRYN